MSDFVSRATCASSVRSILVVDDDKELRAVIAALLEANGWSVAIAGDGVEALGLVRVSVPDVVLTDLEMPVMGGPELTRILRPLPLPPRVILMSGRGGTKNFTG